MLDRTLADIRKRIARAGSKGLNENNTKATLIEPLLRALGWDVEDVDEVAREYRLKTRDKPVDYALLALREPRLFVEAKGLGENLDDRRWANQIMGYAAVAGVEWIVLTDGNEYRLYNTHAAVPVEQKLFRAVRLSDGSDEAARILALVAKANLKTNSLDALWRAHFVDRKVKAALERLFAPDHDMALVNHVRGIAKDLSAEDIRGSMRRCKLALDFPLSPGDLVEPARRVRVTNPSAPTRAPKSSKPDWKVELGKEVTLVELIEVGLLKAPLKLTRHYKGRDVEARVLPDGNVECLGQVYSSPSAAASAARASVTGLREDGQMRATNGWTFWRYKMPQGDLADIDAIRQEYLKRRPGSPGGVPVAAG